MVSAPVPANAPSAAEGEPVGSKSRRQRTWPEPRPRRLRRADGASEGYSPRPDSISVRAAIQGGVSARTQEGSPMGRWRRWPRPAAPAAPGLALCAALAAAGVHPVGPRPAPTAPSKGAMAPPLATTTTTLGAATRGTTVATRAFTL